MRVEANRVLLIAETLALLVAGIGAYLALITSSLPLAAIASVITLLVGWRFLIRVGIGRLFGAPYVVADEQGITCRGLGGVARYPWGQVISVMWTHMRRIPFGGYSVVEITPDTGDPNSPYGRINPHDIYLWFLGNKRRSRELGQQFLAVCRRYGTRTRLVVGGSRKMADESGGG